MHDGPSLFDITAGNILYERPVENMCGKKGTDNPRKARKIRVFCAFCVENTVEIV